MVMVMSVFSTQPGTGSRLRRSGPGWRLLAVLALAAVGCSGKGEINGRVTYDNQPIPRGRITFLPQRGGARTAEIRDGNYTITDCPTGQMSVGVESFVPPESAGEGPGVPEELLKGFKPPGGAPGGAVGEKFKGLPIPPKYADPKQSGLEYTVTSGKQTKDFPLTP